MSLESHNWHEIFNYQWGSNIDILDGGNVAIIILRLGGCVISNSSVPIAGTLTCKACWVFLFGPFKLLHVPV